MMEKNVDFVPNTDDNTHCLQASVKMTLRFFDSNFDRDLDFFDAYTGKSEKFAYTWPLRTALNAALDGFHVVYIDELNLEALSKDPYQTLLEAYGEEIASDQCKNSDMVSVVSDAKELLLSRNVEIQFRVPNTDDLRRLLDDGYLLILNVNSRAMRGAEGYMGHFITVYGYDENRFSIHNPGLPPEKNVRVSDADLNRGWSYPSEKYRNILALKKDT